MVRGRTSPGRGAVSKRVDLPYGSRANAVLDDPHGAQRNGPESPYAPTRGGAGGRLKSVEKTLARAVSTFGSSAKSKLASPAISGAPEDQLRAPLEALMRDLGEIGGLPAGSVHLVGETTLADLKTRPDFAVTTAGAAHAANQSAVSKISLPFCEN
jgi:hypothetical protein